MPTRQAIVPDLLGPRLAPGGISLNAVGMQAALPVALFAVGFLNAALGFAGTYALASVGHVVQVVLLLRMRYRSTLTRRADEPRGGLRRTSADVWRGIRYARGHRVVLWSILLLIAMGGLGSPAVAGLGPTWITTVVGVSVRDFGFVAISWGGGALLASMLLTRFALFERKGLLITLGALGFALSFVIFAIPTVPSAVLGNLGLGASLATAQVSATVLIQHLVPNEVRGRVMALLMVNRGLGQLMTLPLAAAAQVVSLRTLFPVLASTLLAIVVLIVVTQPSIRRARIRTEREAAPARRPR